MQLDSGKSTLIIDGEYFLITFRNLFGNEEPNEQFLRLFLQIISVQTQASLKMSKYFFCGCPQNCANIMSKYISWKKMGFRVDIRDLKKEVDRCSYCNVKNYKLIEAEVDVAIGVRIAREALGIEKPQSLVIIGGDRDYIDAVNLALEQDIETYIIGDKHSVSYRYKEIRGINCILSLSYIMKKCYDFLDGESIMYKALCSNYEYYYKMQRVCKGRSFFINILSKRDSYDFDDGI
jgi:hypothetical protein